MLIRHVAKSHTHTHIRPTALQMWWCILDVHVWYIEVRGRVMFCTARIPHSITEYVLCAISLLIFGEICICKCGGGWVRMNGLMKEQSVYLSHIHRAHIQKVLKLIFDNK